MATTVRVNRLPLGRRFTRVAGVGIGVFGRRVVELLAAGRDATPHGEGDVETAFDAEPDVVVLALWRPSPAICERADALAYERKVAWLPVIMEHPYIRVGPLVMPPARPCWNCYRRRRRQHDDRLVVTDALHAAYDADPDCGPGGFLPHHARVAAGVAAAVLDEAAARVVTIRLGTLAVSADAVVPVHGCERCGEPMPERDPRDLFRLRPPGEAHAC